VIDDDSKDDEEDECERLINTRLTTDVIKQEVCSKYEVMHVKMSGL